MTSSEGLAASFDRLTDQISGFRTELTDLQKDLKNSKRKGWRAILGSYALWVIDIGLIVIVAVFGHAVTVQSECQAKQNTAFQQAAASSRVARDKADEQAIAQLDAQLTLFETVLSPDSTLEQRRSASLSYRQSVLGSRAAIVNTKKIRADNPYPPIECS